MEPGFAWSIRFRRVIKSYSVLFIKASKATGGVCKLNRTEKNAERQGPTDICNDPAFKFGQRYLFSSLSSTLFSQRESMLLSRDKLKGRNFIKRPCLRLPGAEISQRIFEPTVSPNPRRLNFQVCNWRNDAIEAG